MSSRSNGVASGTVDGFAEPIHLQKLYKSLRLDILLDYIEQEISQPISDSDSDSSSDDDLAANIPSRLVNDESCFYNFASVQRKRRWLCDAILHSSDSEESEASIIPTLKRHSRASTAFDRRDHLKRPTNVLSLNTELGKLTRNLDSDARNDEAKSEAQSLFRNTFQHSENDCSDHEVNAVDDSRPSSEYSTSDSNETEVSSDQEQTDHDQASYADDNGRTLAAIRGRRPSRRLPAKMRYFSDSFLQANAKSRIDTLMKNYLLRKKHVAGYQALSKVENGSEQIHKGHNYLYYGAGLLSNIDRYHENQKQLANNFRKTKQSITGSGGGRLLSSGAPARGSSSSSSSAIHGADDERSFMHLEGEAVLNDESVSLEDAVSEDPSKLRARASSSSRREKKFKKADAQTLVLRRHKLWLMMIRKEVLRQQRTRAAAHKEVLHNAKRLAVAATKVFKQRSLQSQKIVKDKAWLLKRLCRSMQVEWKKYDRIMKEQNKRAEREAEEQRKMDKEIMEAKRQQRKVNFLITLPELYAHFMQNKMSSNSSTEDTSAILRQLEEAQPSDSSGTFEDFDCEALKAQALQTAQEAVRSQQSRLKNYDGDAAERESPAHSREWPQPEVFIGQLKCYQLKGMNWLANLYYFGINGILADEMGLGKTVQTIAFLAHVCEEYDTWGPFLIVTPASTLHNWTEEIARFVPEFKVVPYWGTPDERKLLRKFFDSKDCGERRKTSFHVVVTSYHIVIQDFKFLNRIKWNYMVLDEAQAIKSIQSQRWKLLLGFSCRNRLLLSGTPIQNTMAELWALLHFIMPALFDSHQWFNEWFSKDIEGHVENKTHVDEKHLNRLHTILKPFMLRRVKSEVENELTEKIEIMVYCPLTLRQKFLYSGLKNKISIDELLHSSSGSGTAQSSAATNSLMNLVMQFRKVCNHPELLERREVQSPFCLKPEPYLLPRFLFRVATGLDMPDHYHIFAKLSPFDSYHIHNQLYYSTLKTPSLSESWAGSWWFASLCGLSVGELSAVLQRRDFVLMWLLLFEHIFDRAPLETFRSLWHRERSLYSSSILVDFNYKHRFLEDTETNLKTSMKLVDKTKGSFRTVVKPVHLCIPRRQLNNVYSCDLPPLAFCRNDSSLYTFSEHIFHRMPETSAHRAMRVNRQKKLRIEATCTTDNSEEGATVKSEVVVEENIVSGPYKSFEENSVVKSEPPDLLTTELEDCSSASFSVPPPPQFYMPPVTRYNQRTYMPSFLTDITSKVESSQLKVYSYSCNSYVLSKNQRLDMLSTLLRRGHRKAYASDRRRWLCPIEVTSEGGFEGISSRTAKWSRVIIPDKHSLMMDSGKLFVLDSLLRRMKAAGNRVLIYSQMTKMINLLEEYMRHRQHKYMRLDGSSKISDRRDMVADFQTNSDIFVFLLSTRAGGVGINLTAADTVIFYDSDWNPTVDQQAMDRAHRVGQTKQVTVYRLICKGTIEERILQRAKEKSEIQRIVISGGNFKPDTLKPKEVVSLLLEDDIEQQFRARQHERRLLDEQRIEYNREKMRKRYAEKKLEREQLEFKKRRLEDDAASSSTISAAPSPALSEESEDYKDLVSPSSATAFSSEPGSFSRSVSPSPGQGLLSGQSLLGTTVRGHRKRGRPRMNGIRGRPGGRGQASTSAAAYSSVPALSAAGTPFGAPVKRGRGRPRLLPLGPGNQGQRPIQQLPAALGSLQSRATEDS